MKVQGNKVEKNKLRHVNKSGYGNKPRHVNKLWYGNPRTKYYIHFCRKLIYGNKPW